MAEHSDKSKAELEKHMYCMAEVGRQADQYAKSTKAIAEYVGRVYGQEMRSLVLSGTESVPKEPVYPSTGTNMEKAVWSKKYDLFLKKEEKYLDYKAKVFTIIMGQCNKPMRNMVESASGFAAVETAYDVAGLLRIIKDIAFNANDKKFAPMQAAVAWRSLTRAWQQEGEDLVDYYKRFISLVELVERSYGKVAPEEAAKKNEKEYKKNPVATVDIERGRMLAFMFMDGANKKLYGSLVRGLENDHALGAVLYPDTVEDALQVLTLHSEHGLRKVGKGKQLDEGLEMSMSQVAKKKGKCWKCGKAGHVKKDCPEGGTVTGGTSNAQVPSWMS
jgi:hypothetical protein